MKDDHFFLSKTSKKANSYFSLCKLYFTHNKTLNQAKISKKNDFISYLIKSSLSYKENKEINLVYLTIINYLAHISQQFSPDLQCFSSSLI